MFMSNSALAEEPGLCNIIYLMRILSINGVTGCCEVITLSTAVLRRLQGEFMMLTCTCCHPSEYTSVPRRLLCANISDSGSPDYVMSSRIGRATLAPLSMSNVQHCCMRSLTPPSCVYAYYIFAHMAAVEQELTLLLR